MEELFDIPKYNPYGCYWLDPLNSLNFGDNLSTDEIPMNNGMIENSTNLNQQHLDTPFESIRDATTHDTKFNKTFTNDYILMKGKGFFQKENCTTSVYTEGNMGRSFIVQIERNCFKRALDILQLTDSEIKIVKEARELETRRLNTKKSRSKLDATKDSDDVKALEQERNELIHQIETLKAEISEYKEKLGHN